MDETKLVNQNFQPSRAALCEKYNLLICQLCNLELPNLATFGAHMRTHISQQHLNCSVCGCEFESAEVIVK